MIFNHDGRESETEAIAFAIIPTPFSQITQGWAGGRKKTSIGFVKERLSGGLAP